MEEKLNHLLKECIEELEGIGLSTKALGNIDIALAKRNSNRYGCCKQENPVESTKYIQKIGRKKHIRYTTYQNHHIEISKWVMQLEDSIIKNTIMHELIHCFPNCNNHGKPFKAYAKYINEKLAYQISRLGNKQEDFAKSNLPYAEQEHFHYKIECKNCGQIFYRKRLSKNFTKKYRCAKCKGTLKVSPLVK